MRIPGILMAATILMLTLQCKHDDRDPRSPKRPMEAEKPITAAVESLVVSRESIWYYDLRIRFRNRRPTPCRVEGYTVRWADKEHPAVHSFSVPAGGTRLRVYRLNIARDTILEKSPSSAQVIIGKTICDGLGRRQSQGESSSPNPKKPGANSGSLAKYRGNAAIRLVDFQFTSSEWDSERFSELRWRNNR